MYFKGIHILHQTVERYIHICGRINEEASNNYNELSNSKLFDKIFFNF